MNKKTCLLCITVLSLLLGCDSPSKPEKKPGNHIALEKASESNGEPRSTILDDPKDKLSSEITNSKRSQTNAVNFPKEISFLELEKNYFRVNGAGVAIQDFIDAEMLVVTYLKPKIADYIEILRCNADAEISGPFQSLSEVEIGSSDFEAESKIMLANNFWKAATKNASCLQIASHYTHPNFYYDTFADSGDYMYLMRSCVDQTRFTDSTDQIQVRTCSRLVTKTDAYRNFINTRLEEERAALNEANSKRMLIEQLGRDIFYTIQRMNRVEDQCLNDNQKRLEKNLKSQAIYSLIGVGVGIGAEILSGGGITGSDGISFESIWKGRGSIGGAGAKIATALNEVFASPDDYLRSCTAEGSKGHPELKQLLIAGKTKMEELKMAHQDYLDAIETSKNAAKKRKEIENAKVNP